MQYGEAAKCQNFNDFLHSLTGECQSELWTVASLSQSGQFKLKRSKSGSTCNEKHPAPNSRYGVVKTIIFQP